MPYIHLSRIQRPTGIMLIWLPCLWGLALVGTHPYNFMRDALYYLVGAFSMRTVGCIINDIFDRSFDAQVQRTKMRPLASGALNVQEALLFMLLMLLPGLCVFCWLSPESKMIAFIAFIGAMLYPLAKRVTHWPQLVLGLVFNSGVLVAGYEHTALVNVLLVYSAGIFWTLAYDTIYAFQDVEDDLQLGLGSTAVRFYKYPKTAIAAFYSGMLGAMGALGMFNNGTVLYASGCVLLAATIATFLWHWNPRNTNQCLLFFKQNILIGFMILYLIVLLIRG
ncbi:MAG: 4-hydroxybenzoate octaprenyltransferase [Alphaproteobacteria bacterium]|nr:4-hydroxybenzoate octaprenyltransferase [Alphaproteobacteria bacterium]